MTADDQNKGIAPLVMPTDAQVEAAREILQAHIDALNANYANAVADMQKDTEQFKTFSKRSTYLVWAMFWVSGFLARGMFRGGHIEWNLTSICFGIALGACAYFAVHGFVLKILTKKRG